MKRILVSILFVLFICLNLTGLSFVERVQFRWINVANVPNPICNILGVGTSFLTGGLLFAPEAGIIVGGTYLTIEDEAGKTSIGAFGGGAFSGVQIGIVFGSSFFISVRPEFSYIYLISEPTKWSILELGSDVGFGFLSDDVHFYIDVFRFGMRPGGGSVFFVGFYPGVGFRFRIS
jgi:hypothetical protein